MSDSKEDVKLEATGTGSLPIESGPGETNDTKTLERENESKPSDIEVEKELKREMDANDEEIKAATVKKEKEANKKMDEQLKMTDSEKEEKVVQDAVKQITFYLSDSNLPYDKFLFTQSMKDKPADAPMGTGWIPLSTILSFKRMQEIISKSSRSATICEFAIVNALRSAYPSKDEDALLQVSDDGHDVRRKKELTPPSQTGQMDRSVYVKGFPEEEESASSSSRGGRSGGDKNYSFSPLQQELESWFESLGFGRVNAVRMRRDESKKFKQSVFVEFATTESATAFLEMKDKPTYPGQSEAIETMSKKAYIDMKAVEKGIKPEYGSNRQASSRDNNKAPPFNAFRDHANLGGDRRRGGDREDKPLEVKVFVEGKELDVDQETGRVKNPDEITYTSGKVIRFEGVGDSEEGNPVELKRSLTDIQPPVFVDYARGETSGVVFFKDVVSEENLKKLQDANLKFGGSSITWTAITGDEEKQYHHERAHKRASIALADAQSGNTRGNDRSSRSGGGRGGSRGGGRGQRGGRGRGGGRDRDGGRGNDRRGGDRRNGDRPNDRNEEREKNEKKRDREEDGVPSPKKEGSAISVPEKDSSGPAAEPPAKKAKTEDA